MEVEGSHRHRVREAVLRLSTGPDALPWAATSRPATLLLAGAAALFVLIGCSGEGGTQPSATPSDLVRVSSVVDSAAVGEATDPPFAVRVENSVGEPVEGLPVRFAVVDGPGEVFPNLAVSNAQGVAEASFRAGSEPGSSRVRVDVPSASNVAPAHFDVVTVPAAEVSLSRVEGDGQEAEVGSQLPLPFALQVDASSGVPAGGVRIAWELVDAAPDGAVLSSDTTFTDPDGRTENLLTLGGQPGEHLVRTFATDGVASDTAMFTTSALEALPGPTVIDSLGADTLVADQEAVLYGEGFGETASDVDVRVEGVSGTVLEVTGESVRFTVPGFGDRCLPRRTVGVRILVQGSPSNGAMATLEPAADPLELAAGESRTISGNATRCLHLAGAGPESEYLLVAGSSAGSGAATTPMRLMLRASDAIETTDPSVSVRSNLRTAGPDLELPEGLMGDELRIRQSAHDQLARRRIGVRGATGEQARTAQVPGSPPEVGDVLELNFAVGQDLSVSCTDTTSTMGAVVRATGPHVVLAEDTLAPSNGFDDGDWETLLDEFESVVFPTDSAYFGGPADLDGNGRIVVTVTPRVNGLTPRGAGSRVGGFFLPIDLVDAGDEAGGGLRGPEGETCAASNEGEFLYLLAPDPDGAFSDPVRPGQALRNARSVTAHELMHLLSTQQRLVFGEGDFESLEEVWLAEGLSHIAEEVVGLRLMERGSGENLAWTDMSATTGDLNDFNTFHLNNFARLDLFMRDPVGAPALSLVEPGGVRGLQMRGFAWSFLRWLADRPGSGAEADLFRQLSTGGGAGQRGTANVERAIGQSWETLLTEYRLALLLDDAETAGESDHPSLASWNLRSVFAGLNQNQNTQAVFTVPYPLAVTPLPFGTATVDFETRASTAAFFRLEGGDGEAPLAVGLADQSGGSVPSSAEPEMTLHRSR